MPTITVVPVTDVTAGWDTTTGADHYTEVDEGTTSPNDNNYIQTTTIGSVDEFSLGNVPANANITTQVDVNTRGILTDSGGAARIQVDLLHSGSTLVGGSPKYITGADFGGYSTTGTFQLSWTGLTLTKTQADSLTLRYTFLAS